MKHKLKKDIQLCGIGNGLVDLQYEVPHSIITELGLQAGQMTLVDTQSQRRTIDNLAGYKFNRCSGGSAANTVIAFTQLGGKAAYKTVIGNDEPGRFYSGEFEQMGIMLRTQMLESHPTGTCLVLITPDSERTMLTALGASAEFSKSHVDEEIITRSEWLYIEGYKFSQFNSTKAIYEATRIAIAGGTKVAVTFSDVFITELFHNNLLYVAENADLIFCNEAEAKSFTKASDSEEAFRRLEVICPNIVVTYGSKGSKIKWYNQIHDIPAYKAQPIDTTGAGDMFAGAFLYGIFTTKNPLVAGHLASAASARVVSQYGARLNEDIREIRDDIFGKFL